MRIDYGPPDPVPSSAAGEPTRLAFGDGILASLGDQMRGAGLGGRAFVVADEAVGARFGREVVAVLDEAGYRPELATFVPGEASKSLEVASTLFAWLAGHRAERRDVIVALGGGVAGDLAGFVAATWLRGVPLVQVPTTLLAMVDSSVGGKTAVNLPAGKNLVGAFHPPVLTLVDVATLTGLPGRELRAGWAEAIKTAVIFDPPLLEQIGLRDPGTIERAELAAILERTVRWKERVVHADPRERGIRVVLNFGHTIAHAIEATAGYGAYLHGEAVAIGMVAATRLSVVFAGLDPVVAGHIETVIAAAGLRVRLDPRGPDVEAILDRTLQDKKVEGARVRWVLVAEPGRTVVTDEVAPDAVRAVVTGLQR